MVRESNQSDANSPRPTLLVLALDDTECEQIAALPISNDWAKITYLSGGIETLTQYCSAHADMPDVILIELASQNSAQSLDSLNYLSQIIPEHVYVYAYGDLNDIGFFKSLQDMGIANYFVGRPTLRDFHGMVKSRITAETYRQAIVIGVAGLAGGVGTSTLAINLVQYAATNADLHVLLIDGCASYNPMTALCGADYLGSLSNPRPHYITIKPKFDFYTPTTDVRSEMDDQEETVKVIQDNLSHYDLIVIDIGLAQKIYRSNFISYFDHVLLVAEPDFKSLNVLKSQSDKLDAAHFIRSFSLALTQVEMEDRAEFGQEDFRIQSDLKIHSTFRHDPQAYTQAYLKGIPFLPVNMLVERNAFKDILTLAGVKISDPATTTSTASSLISSVHSRIRRLLS